MRLFYHEVCEENPVDLFVNGNRMVTFMCTPKDLKELILGHLHSRRLIDTVEEVIELGPCEDVRRIFVTTAKELPEEEYSLRSVLTSGCGGGAVFLEKFFEQKSNHSSLAISMSKLKELTVQMFHQAKMYKDTGGVHCAALINREEIVAFYEDVGRHNAVDKVIGKGLLLELDFTQSLIVSTGRISSDMLLKAVASGIPIIVSRSIPSSLALEMAEKMGITIVGRAISKEPIVYTYPHRIIQNEKYAVGT